MKRLMTAVFVILLAGAILLTGCGVVPTNTDEISLDYGMTADSALYNGDSAGIVITNNGDRAITHLEVAFHAYDGNDEEIVYEDGDPAAEFDSGKAEGGFVYNEVILPGESVATAFSPRENFGLAESPDHFTAEVKKVTWKDPSEVDGADVVLTDVSYAEGSSEATVTLRNDTEFDYDNEDLYSAHNLMIYAICRDSDGKIIGGDSAQANYLAAHAEETSMVFFLGDIAALSPADVEFYASRTDFTEEEMETLTVEE